MFIETVRNDPVAARRVNPCPTDGPDAFMGMKDDHSPEGFAPGSDATHEVRSTRGTKTLSRLWTRFRRAAELEGSGGDVDRWPTSVKTE